jgi:hypothetical protein
VAIIISKCNLSKIIEPEFHSCLNSDSYNIETIKALKLLRGNRFDLAFKLLFLELEGVNKLYAKEVYKEHIRAFSLGDYTEPGNKEKNNLDKYYEVFTEIFKGIKDSDFDRDKSIIPISKTGSFLNGSHRVASAIFLDTTVDCVNIDIPSFNYDYTFFYNRKVPSKILESVATTFVEHAENVYVALIWPIADGKDNDIEKIIPNIVYRKKFHLNPNGAHNFLSQVYCGEDWIGSIEDNFAGVSSKLVECFKRIKPVKAIVFQADSLNSVVSIKEKIRVMIGAGKHSIHITDTRQEAINIARVVLNNNSLHFLNYAKPNKYFSTHNIINEVKEFLQKDGIINKDFLLDSGIVLSLYGLRKNNDVDYFLNSDKGIKAPRKNFEDNDSELKYHQLDKLEMIYNSQYYFYFNGLKFVSFEQLYKMKKNRGYKRDALDCSVMSALIENNISKSLLVSILQNLFYFKLKVRKKTIHVLKLLGMHGYVKRFVRKVK